MSGYLPGKTAEKSGAEGLRSLGLVIATAAGAWALSPEGTATLETAVPVSWLAALPVAHAVIRAGLDWLKHRNHPVVIGRGAVEDARRRYEEENR